MTEMALTVHSDSERKPRYFVTKRNILGLDVVVFESDDGSETVQWAIDHCNIVEVTDPINLKSGAHLHGRNEIIRMKKKPTETRKNGRNKASGNMP